MVKINPKLKKVCGPGIEGYEDCPTFYHIDFTEDEFQALLAKPTSVLQSLGYETDSAVVTIINKAWSTKQEKWVALGSVVPDSGGTVSPQGKWCCIAAGDVVSCGRWYYA